MSREIKFRGKRAIDDKWLFGSLVTGLFHDVKTKVESCNIMDTIDYPDFDCFQDFDDMDTDVVTETVGQYTGLKDKNGVEIYEGDIFHNFGLSGFCVCVFQNGGFGYHVNDSNGKYASFISFANNHWYEWEDGKTDMIEIVGNIHQNPELLKGGDSENNMC